MNLEIFWSTIHRRNGWLSGLFNLGFPESLCWELFDLDESFPYSAKNPSFRYDKPEVDSNWAKERRVEYLNDKISIIRKNLVLLRIQLAKEKDDFSRCLIEARLKEISKQIKKHENELKFKFLEKAKISDEMVETARNYPLSSLLKKSGMISCPLHEDKHPSFSIRHFGHCFSCGENFDSIKWLIEIEGFDFKDAVLKLQEN